MKAPFPYFGGKSKIAGKVWEALGSPAHYLEPFFGSGAVLLSRPNYNPGMCETICEKDGFVANVWRGIKFDPDEVAKWCDWPVNHIDLNARRKELIRNEERLIEKLTADPEWFDAKLAGYWVWAASCWIGSGMTSGGTKQKVGQMPFLSKGKGQGVNQLSQMPLVGHRDKGINQGKMPFVGKAGRKVALERTDGIYAWINELSFRLRNVRVVCGDWSRICGGNWQDNIGVCGMFFDPPYGVKDRDTKVYHHDSVDVAADVMEWVKNRGESKRYRIVLAGYEEYAPLVENHGWTCEKWKAQGGYANTGKGKGDNNRHRETLYYSPHCVNREKEVTGVLF